MCRAGQCHGGTTCLGGLTQRSSCGIGSQRGDGSVVLEERLVFCTSHSPSPHSFSTLK